MGGALPEAELVEVVTAVGLVSGQIVERFNTYDRTSAKAKLAADVGVHGVNLLARKPRS